MGDSFSFLTLEHSTPARSAGCNGYPAPFVNDADIAGSEGYYPLIVPANKLSDFYRKHKTWRLDTDLQITAGALSITINSEVLSPGVVGLDGTAASRELDLVLQGKTSDGDFGPGIFGSFTAAEGGSYGWWQMFALLGIGIGPGLNPSIYQSVGGDLKPFNWFGMNMELVDPVTSSEYHIYFASNEDGVLGTPDGHITATIDELELNFYHRASTNRGDTTMTLTYFDLTPVTDWTY